jgi:ADP-ribose pyrophosphatase YjhB (NUDIX family)
VIERCRDHKLVADVAVLASGQVLLVKYRDVSRYDGQRGWFLPDDYLEHREHPADGAKRIVREQTGLADAGAELAHIESFGNGAWHLIFHFRVEVREPFDVEPRGNVAAAQWFPLDSLPPPDELAHEGWAADVLAEMTTQ